MTMKHRVNLLLTVLMLCGLLFGNVVYAKEKLVIMGYFASGWGETLQKDVQAFAQANNIDIEVLNQPNRGTNKSKVALMVTSGESPDVLYGDGDELCYFIHNKLALPLDAYIARDGVNMKRFPAATLDIFNLYGSQWVLPTAVSIYNVYYNVNMLDNAGVNPPPASWESDKFTWNDMIEMARKLTVDANGDGTPERWGIFYNGTIGAFSHIGLWNQWWVSKDVTEYYGDTPAVISAMEQLTSLWTMNKVNGGKLLAGTAAMEFTQSFFLNELKTASAKGTAPDWSVGILPKGTHRWDQAGFHGLTIASGSKNPDMAWKLIKYLAMDTEGVTAFTRGENRVPVIKEAAIDFAKRTMDLIGPDRITAFTGAPNYVYDLRFWRTADATKIMTVVSGAITDVINGKMSVRQALESTAPAARSYLVKK